MAELKRKQRALAENIIMQVRERTGTWTSAEMWCYNDAVTIAFNKVRASLRLEDTWSRENIDVQSIKGRIGIIERVLVDAIRIARTYHNISAEEILEVLLSIEGTLMVIVGEP